MSRDEIVELMARAWNNNEWLWSKNALCIIGNNPARLEALKERELAKALAALTDKGE